MCKRSYIVLAIYLGLIAMVKIHQDSEASQIKPLNQILLNSESKLSVKDLLKQMYWIKSEGTFYTEKLTKSSDYLPNKGGL